MASGQGDLPPRVVTWLLSLYPLWFRQEFGPDLLIALRERAQDLPRARRARLRFWLRECGSLLVCALREQLVAGRSVVVGGDLPRSGWPSLIIEQAWRETRYAARRLLRNPGFSAGAVLALGLAIGANVGVFTLVRSILLTPLPYPDSERLVILDHHATHLDLRRGIGIALPFYEEYARAVPEVEQVAFYRRGSTSVQTHQGAEEVRYTAASRSLVDVLGVTPQLGRWFTAADEGRPVVVLAHRFWQRAFRGDPGVLGRTISVAGHPQEIIGVMPPEMAFPDEQTAFWLQAVARPETDQGFSFEAVGRMSEQTTIEQLRVALNAAISRLVARPDLRTFGELGIVASPVLLKEQTVAAVARPLWVLFEAVAIVLLVACANIGNLFLLRAEARRQELAMRRTLGSGRRGLVLYFLSETLLLGILAGALGWVLARTAVQALVASARIDLPRLNEVHLDATAAIFTLGVTLLASSLLCALPVLRISAGRSPLPDNASRGSTPSTWTHGVRGVLATAQLALALVLLICAGLTLRSFDYLRRVDLGFDDSLALVFHLNLPSNTYPDDDRIAVFHGELQRRLSTLPGVRAVSGTTCFPLGDPCSGDFIAVEGQPVTSTDQLKIVWRRQVASGFFQTMGSAIRLGRDFEPAEYANGAPVAIVNEALVEAYFKGENPIGKRIHPGSIRPDSGQQGEPVWFTVVGVVENMATSRLGGPPEAQVYVPATTLLAPVFPAPRAFTYVVRTTRDPLSVLPAVRRAVADLDPGLPVGRPETLKTLIQSSRAQLSLTMVLLVLAASVALCLGITGIYVVVSYTVAQRAREFGVRLALGATAGQVSRMILIQASSLVGIGIGVGLLAAILASRLVDTMLFGVSRTDVTTYAGGAAFLASVATLACYLATRRIARLDPAVCLRES